MLKKIKKINKNKNIFDNNIMSSEEIQYGNIRDSSTKKEDSYFKDNSSNIRESSTEKKRFFF